MQKQVAELLQKDMSRKEFFTTLGFGLAAVTGVGTILQLIGKDINPLEQLQKQKAESPMGYGMNSYGR